MYRETVDERAHAAIPCQLGMSIIDDHCDETCLIAPWSFADYMRWQREQDALEEEVAREAANARITARYDPECEAAVRALEEGWWGARCQGGLDDTR